METEDSASQKPRVPLSPGSSFSLVAALATQTYSLLWGEGWREQQKLIVSGFVCLLVCLFVLDLNRFFPGEGESSGSSGTLVPWEGSCVTFVYLVVCDVLICVAGASPCL